LPKRPWAYSLDPLSKNDLEFLVEVAETHKSAPTKSCSLSLSPHPPPLTHTQVPDTADLVVPENSAQKRALGGVGSSGGGGSSSSNGGSGVKGWLGHSEQTPPAWHGDNTPTGSGNKENGGSVVSPRLDKRRRIDSDLQDVSSAGEEGGGKARAKLGRTPAKSPRNVGTSRGRALAEAEKNVAQW